MIIYTLIVTIKFIKKCDLMPILQQKDISSWGTASYSFQSSNTASAPSAPRQILCPLLLVFDLGFCATESVTILVKVAPDAIMKISTRLVSRSARVITSDHFQR